MIYTTTTSMNYVKFKTIRPGEIFFQQSVNDFEFYIKTEELNEGYNAFCITDNCITRFSDDANVSKPESFELKIAL